MKIKKTLILFAIILLLLLSCDKPEFTNMVDTDFTFPAPTEFSITLTSPISCELNWQDNSEGEQGFKIDRKKDSEEWVIAYQTVNENVETLSETNLTSTSTYQYRVYGFADENTSAPITGEINMTFPAPTNLSISITSVTSCELNWDYSGFGDEEGFKIERRLSGGSWAEIAQLEISNTDYEDTGLTEGETYEYQVYAYNSLCNGNAVFETIELSIVFEGFVFVEGGTFQMGDRFGEGSSNELPLHDVTLNSFYMAETEVTQAEYEELIGNNPSNSSYGIGDNYPVNTVSWYDMIAYCNAKSTAEGLTPVYSGSGTSTTCDWNANGYRLPTEAEWEYAARGGNEGDNDNYRYSGCHNESDLPNYAWYSSNSSSTSHEVGTKLHNQLGLYDMSGNLWEWCWDWYDSSYYSSSPSSNPHGADGGSYRVLRGGYWSNSAHPCRVAHRADYTPSYTDYYFGFRVCRNNPE